VPPIARVQRTIAQMHRHVRAYDVVVRLAVPWHSSIEVDEPANAFRYFVCCRCDDRAAIAVADQHDVGEIPAAQQRDHVGNVGCEPDLGSE
jgi:hypothetical protein